MGTDEYGQWEPLSVAEVQSTFADAPFRWWVSGGRALDLFVGRSWRVHEDTDVGVVRRDVPRLRQITKSWDVQVAAAGELTVWRDQALFADRHENNLWCRKDSRRPWCLDVTVGEGDDESWMYRRDPHITAKWESAVLYSNQGVPFLAPEIQLLFKSKDVRDKDETDARTVIPILDTERREWLFSRLPSDHPWHATYE